MDEHPVAARARALVGVRFRPQGRRPEQGLDCVGLAAVAANLAGDLIPTGYPMRSEADPDALTARFAEVARPVAPEAAETGDVLIVEYAPHQHHLLVLVDGGFVHADARLGRVVQTPGPVAWPVVAAWRILAARNQGE